LNHPETHRIPSLDGLRAVSIIFVVLGHAFKEYFGWLDFANLGVRVFFVISAYLIIGILLRDIEKKRFSLKMFYLKRIFRTFPAFYSYLIIVAVFLTIIGKFEWQQFWRAPVYLENYHPRSHWNENQWFVGHSWSLAVEEQFYIVISFLFIFLNKKIVSKMNLIKIMVLILLIIPFIRLLYLFCDFIPDVFSGSIHRSFETVADSLAIGGLMILLPKDTIQSHPIVKYFKSKIWLLIGLILLMQMMNSSVIVNIVGLKTRYFYNLIGLSILNICLGLLVFILINSNESSRLFRILNTRLFVLIGLWSYSIYLWQQVWLFPWDIPMVYKIIGLILSSLLSYYLIEKKFLIWRDQLVKKWF
jgi:peptidoglycan/LPS O-acetylase OafA/YrhL